MDTLKSFPTSEAEDWTQLQVMQCAGGSACALVPCMRIVQVGTMMYVLRRMTAFRLVKPSQPLCAVFLQRLQGRQWSSNATDQHWVCQHATMLMPCRWKCIC